MLFTDLKLDELLLRAIEAEGYTQPTPIQAQAIPHVLQGRDLLGVAQTGTGKTAAFALPMLQRLMGQRPPNRPIRALILTPTRELASQIAESLDSYGRHTGLVNTVIFGGVGQHAQEQALKRGLDILVATPGRLLDLMNQGLVKLNCLEIFVLDEADRMLDMGFIHDVKKVLAALPRRRQSLFFSATMPPDIVSLSGQILVNPARVEVTPPSTTAEKVEQFVYFADKPRKRQLLVHLLQGDSSIKRVIVFTRTKHGANRVSDLLERQGIQSAAIHGNKSQNARERALGGFREGTVRVLVATDIAARGIDVEDITHVVNFELPNVAEQYVHRIGRTARAGRSGIAISFCDDEERSYLRDIEKLTRQKVTVLEAPKGLAAVAPEGPSRPERDDHRHDPGHARPQSAPHGASQAHAPANHHARGGQAPRPAPRHGGGRPAQQATPHRGGGRPNASPARSGGGGGHGGGHKPAGHGGGRPSGGGRGHGGRGR